VAGFFDRIGYMWNFNQRMEGMSKRQGSAIETGENREVKSIHEYEKLYHQMRLGDLFLLWRDGEVTMSASASEEAGKDYTTAEPNSVMTFWHTEPILDSTFSYVGFVELDTDQFDKGVKVEEGTMQYGIKSFSDLSVKNGSIPEVYVNERIKKEQVKVFFSDSERRNLLDWMDDETMKADILEIVRSETGEFPPEGFFESEAADRYREKMPEFYDWLKGLDVVNDSDDNMVASYEDFFDEDK
jgi:hypothetical protein